MSEAPGASDVTPADTRSDLRSVVRPVVVFVLAYVVGEWVLTLLGATGALAPLSELTARITHALAVLTGVPATLKGIDVVVPQRILRVSLDCTGAYVFVAYTALVLAQPVKWRSRALGLLAGLPALAALNVVRLVVVTHIAYRAPASFDLWHDFLFQGLMILSALVVWLAWLRLAEKPAAPAAPAAVDTPGART